MGNGVLLLFLIGGLLFQELAVGNAAEEAPVGFDEQSNGLVTQAEFEMDRDVFNEQEKIEDGLGPVYNAQSCGECHQNPVSGGSTQILELRVGHYEKHNFSEPPGGSLIHSRAIDPTIQEYVPDGYNVRTFRAAMSTLGDGFVEAIDDATLIGIAEN